MFEVAWQEFNSKSEIVTKRKSFRTEAALDKFVDKLCDKDNFYKILGYRK